MREKFHGRTDGMTKINLIKGYKSYPMVYYTHCLLNRPVKVFVYKWFPFKGRLIRKIFTKIMAMLHDYLFCYEQDYGIYYGIINVPPRPPRPEWTTWPWKE